LDIVGKLPGTPLFSVRTQLLDVARKNPRLRQGANLDGEKRLVQGEGGGSNGINNNAAGL